MCRLDTPSGQYTAPEVEEKGQLHFQRLTAGAQGKNDFLSFSLQLQKESNWLIDSLDASAPLLASNLKVNNCIESESVGLSLVRAPWVVPWRVCRVQCSPFHSLARTRVLMTD